MTRLIQQRRGVTALLAMMDLVLFSALAIGFYTSTRTTMTVSENDEKINDLLTASESGLQFMRFQMHSMNLAYGTTISNLMANTATALGSQLNGTPNMKGYTVQVSGGQIHIPAASDWINLDSTGNTKFRATISQFPGTTTLIITIKAADKSTSLTRGVRMQFQPNSKSYALMGIQS